MMVKWGNDVLLQANASKMLINPQRKGVFYKRKGRGGAIMPPLPFISARSNVKRLIFQVPKIV